MITPFPTDIIRQASWLAHRYDPGHDAFHFRRVARDDRSSVPFLTDECLGEEKTPVVLSRADCIGQEFTASPPLHFLFHSAYCASTMLIHMLDQPGIATSLSEPVILNDMVGWRRRGAEGRAHGQVMADAFALLSRNFEYSEAVIVKPSNIFNPLAIGAMMLRPEAKAVLLYAPLKDFLLSVARKGMWCRLWCRELLEGYMADGFVTLGFEPRDYFRQSDLQVAAVGWLAQQQEFARLIAWAPTRFATLDSETLTRTPVESTLLVMKHFGLEGDPALVAAHTALKRNSKSGERFEAGDRQRALAAAEQAHGDEISQVIGWANAIAKQLAIPMSLPTAFSSV